VRATIATDLSLCSSVIDTPIGELTVLASRAGVREIVLPGSSVPPCADGSRPCADPAARAICDDALAQLGEYFAGRRTRFDVALDLHGTPFQLLAWRTLTSIPFGRTVGYAEQARMMGRDGAARATGGANGRNPVPIIVPCHRVVGADGSLTGYAARSLGEAGLAMKASLLAHESSVIAARGGTVGA